MKTIFFVQNRKDKKAATVIFLRLSHAPDVCAFSTKIKIPFSAWDAKLKKVKPAYSHSSQINKDLREIEDKVTEILDSMRYDPDFELAKRKIGIIFGNEEEAKGPVSFFEVFDIYLNHLKKNSAKGTYANYNYLKNLLFKFNPKLEFKDLIAINFERFADWLLDAETETKARQSNNTVHKNLSNVRAFLNWCREERNGINVEIPEVPKDFIPVKPHDVEVIYLTEEELLSVYFMPFVEDFEIVRDMFCFGCWTGLRFSDIQALGPGNVRGGLITINMKKVSAQVSIPLNQYSEKILKKYDYHFPRLRNDYCNELLKQVCEVAGFDAPEKLVRFRRKERIEITAPKHQLISFHDSRATFIILLLIKGVPQRIIMEMTGHTDFDSFKKYIKITPSVTRNAMQLAWG